MATSEVGASTPHERGACCRDRLELRIFFAVFNSVGLHTRTSWPFFVRDSTLVILALPAAAKSPALNVRRQVADCHLFFHFNDGTGGVHQDVFGVSVGRSFPLRKKSCHVPFPH